MKNENENRLEIIQNLIASIAVVTWNLDLQMSAAILEDTKNKFGEQITGDIMVEVLDALEHRPNSTKDIINCAAALAFVQPKPLNWSPTIH